MKLRGKLHKRGKAKEGLGIQLGEARKMAKKALKRFKMALFCSPPLLVVLIVRCGCLFSSHIYKYIRRMTRLKLHDFFFFGSMHSHRGGKLFNTKAYIYQCTDTYTLQTDGWTHAPTHAHTYIRRLQG